MQIVYVEMLDAHLNLLGSEDWGVLDRLYVAAQDHMEKQIGWKVADRYESEEDVPASLTQGVLMLAGHWYENREASIAGVAMMAIPYGLDDIINDHRDWVF